MGNINININASPTSQQNALFNYPVIEHKNKWVGAALAFWGGSFGLQKFYTGQTGKGILHLCFSWSGIPYIIGIIDCIKFACMTPEEFDRYCFEKKYKLPTGIRYDTLSQKINSKFTNEYYLNLKNVNSKMIQTIAVMQNDKILQQEFYGNTAMIKESCLYDLCSIIQAMYGNNDAKTLSLQGFGLYCLNSGLLNKSYEILATEYDNGKYNTAIKSVLDYAVLEPPYRFYIDNSKSFHLAAFLKSVQHPLHQNYADMLYSFMEAIIQADSIENIDEKQRKIEISRALYNPTIER